MSSNNIFRPNWFFELKKHIFAERTESNYRLMNYLLCLKRPFIWVSRFRNRCGYGVHSPFAFSLITDVIYEKAPYYGYRVLAEEQKKKTGLPKGARKVNHLLFRLVNRMQPQSIIEVGIPSDSSLYLQAAKLSAGYLFASDQSELFLESDVPVHFLYLNNDKNPALMEDVFHICADRVSSDSLFVIKGVGYSKTMKALWNRMKEDERVGITFDLYDVGLLFFDKTKIKQHYIINF